MPETAIMWPPEPVDPQGDEFRLAILLTSLEDAAKTIRRGVAQASPRGPLRPPLDLLEHEHHWLTRPQIKRAIDAASEIETVVRELRVRMDPRCQRTIGSRPSWMSPDQYDPCRCRLGRSHEGDCWCEHLDSPDPRDDGRTDS